MAKTYKILDLQQYSAGIGTSTKPCGMIWT